MKIGNSPQIPDIGLHEMLFRQLYQVFASELKKKVVQIGYFRA